MIDEAVLEQLGADLGGPDSLREILDAYLSDAQRLMGELEKAEGDHDARGLTMVAHTLKSSSALLGATHLSDLCRDAETAGRAGDVAAARALLPQLVSELHLVTDALRAYRARLGP